MIEHIVLPNPLPYTAISPGQLLVDPLNPSYNAFSSSSPPALNEVLINNNYRDHLTHDVEGRLISSLTFRTPSSYEAENSIHLHADQSHQHSLTNSTTSFNALRNDPSSQSYLSKTAPTTQTLYYVTSVQKLRNPSFTKARPASPTPTSSSPQSSNPKISLPAVHRRDSTLDVDSTSSDAILSVSLRKVRCLLGSPGAPHSLHDIGYAWSYHVVGEDLQLAVGLGEALSPREFRELVGIVAEEDFVDEGEGDEWEGVGGF